ncbi:hypothetical protein PILCRDRAFT_818481 [Piloderma croceum F 1598]|uniref:Formin GTPase-binding domain-containing protein n=1 Tax=Piloderma croceum (strain F 1598) TaxID=765440 RepID=A0A0C3FIH9_PILCF|nr:hypothetical protein PILCRDRAFT_818481 [Piloderma croceum F 1598]
MVSGPGITGEVPHFGKENKPDVSVMQQRSAPNTPVKPPAQKGFGKINEKHKTLKAKEKEMMTESQPEEAVVTEDAFDRLLDDLQIPLNLRPKLATMDSTVKAAMLKSSQALTFNPPSPPLTPRTVRKAHSSDSLASPRPPTASIAHEFPRLPNDGGFVPGSLSNQASVSVTALNISSRAAGSHTRGVSMDMMRTTSRGQVPPVIPTEFTSGKLTKDKALAKNISPARFCSILTSTSSTQLELETVKKLRLLLRNESASWSQEFLRTGGYASLLTRLNEILEVEWREEQHDDQILHELLRCFKALSTSEIGCFALRSSCPTPFVQLVSLLYSDKKPGDVATRQLIIELLLTLFDLYPASSLPSKNINRAHPRGASLPSNSLNYPTLPPPHATFYSLIRALLLTPAPPPTESPASPVSPHAFISSLHTPRIFKVYLQELSDMCRDYFWVFCHPNNTLWNLNDTDEGKVEKPRAPGGMTGGVEFEAMAYFTTHFKLINAMARAAQDLDLPKGHDHSAYQLHSDLFASGIERILLIARKASTTYYPTLHLELSRYITLVAQSRYEIPWTISRLIGPPPTAMCKPGKGSSRGSPGGQVTPSKRAVANGFVELPNTPKIEPIKFD